MNDSSRRSTHLITSELRVPSVSVATLVPNWHRYSTGRARVAARRARAGASLPNSCANRMRMALNVSAVGRRLLFRCGQLQWKEERRRAKGPILHEFPLSPTANKVVKGLKVNGWDGVTEAHNGHGGERKSNQLKDANFMEHQLRSFFMTLFRENKTRDLCPCLGEATGGVSSPLSVSLFCFVFLP